MAAISDYLLDEWAARIVDAIDALPVDDAEYLPWLEDEEIAAQAAEYEDDILDREFWRWGGA